MGRSGPTWTSISPSSGAVISSQERKPILELYVHSGFLPVWHYEQVLAFDVEAGCVLSREDRSEAVAAFRAALLEAEETDRDDGRFEHFLDAIKLRLRGTEAEPSAE